MMRSLAIQVTYRNIALMLFLFEDILKFRYLERQITYVVSKVMVVTRSNCVVLWKMHRRSICVHVSCICFRWTVTNLSWDFMHCTNERKRKLISKYQQTKAIFERRKYNLERLCWKQTYHWSYNWKYCTLINWLCQKFEEASKHCQKQNCNRDGPTLISLFPRTCLHKCQQKSSYGDSLHFSAINILNAVCINSL